MRDKKYVLRCGAIASAGALLTVVAGGCASSSSGGRSQVSTQSNSAPVHQPAVNTYAPSADGAASTSHSGGASDTTCEQFETMDANTQASVVGQMLEEMDQTGWGVDTVLPNVRAMCATYPPNTPISVTMTG